MAASAVDASRGRLPRGPHAALPRTDERVSKRTGADLNNGWLARHGTLYLLDERLMFAPTLLDRALRARRREILLDDVRKVERFPLRVDDWSTKRARMLIHTDSCVYQLLVGDLDAWIDLLQLVYRRRARAGGGAGPEFLREGYLNPLLAEVD